MSYIINLTTLTQGRAQFSSKHANISLIKLALQCPVSIEVSSAAVITHWRQTHRSERKHNRWERQCHSRLSGLTLRPPSYRSNSKGPSFKHDMNWSSILSIITSQWHNFCLSQGHGKEEDKTQWLRLQRTWREEHGGKRFRNKNTLNETDKPWKMTKLNRSRALGRFFKTYSGLNTIQIFFYI